MKKWLSGALCTIFLLGCSYGLDISVTELESGVPRFLFSKPLGAPPQGVTDRVSLNGLRVVRKGRQQDWDYKNPLWAFESKPGSYVEVGSVKYGVIPPSFAEITPAAPLTKGVRYLVVAFGEGATGEKEFELSPDRI